MKIFLFHKIIIFIFLFWATPIFAQTTANIWVDTDGGTCVDNASLVIYDTSTACGTIDAAWTAADAGDIIRIRVGTYSERIAASSNGSSGNLISFISDGGIVTFCGIDFSDNSYLRFFNFTIDTDLCAGGALANVILGGTNDHLEFWHNTMKDSPRGAFRSGVNDRLNNSLIIANIITNHGLGSSGSGNGVSLRGTNNLVAYNEISFIYPDGFGLVDGTNHRYLNNYAHDLSESDGGHVDMFQYGSSSLGLANNLFEANIMLGLGNQEDEHLTNISHGQAPGGTVTENIFRRNICHNISGGCMGVNQASQGTISYTRFYHSTTVESERAGVSEEAGHFFLSAGVTNVKVRNNIEYEVWSTDVTTGIDVYRFEGSGSEVDYNLGFDPDGNVTFASPFSTQTNGQINVNPNFVDVDNDNFTLAAGSGDGSNARGTGGPLTATSGSGTGSTFNVTANNGGWFRGDNTNLDQYGGALVIGDTITVGTDTCTISSISGDAITCAETFTWADAENVYFGTDTTPDLGAYPYKAGGYTLSATYINSGGTITVTPNDASLVRWVICFENGIPVTIDNISPYTCSVGNGTLVIRAYPLYASKILWTTAQEESNLIPIRLRLRN